MSEARATDRSAYIRNLLDDSYSYTYRRISPDIMSVASFTGGIAAGACAGLVACAAAVHVCPPAAPFATAVAVLTAGFLGFCMGGVVGAVASHLLSALLSPIVALINHCTRRPAPQEDLEQLDANIELVSKKASAAELKKITQAITFEYNKKLFPAQQHPQKNQPSDLDRSWLNLGLGPSDTVLYHFDRECSATEKWNALATYLKEKKRGQPYYNNGRRLFRVAMDIISRFLSPEKKAGLEGRGDRDQNSRKDDATYITQPVEFSADTPPSVDLTAAGSAENDSDATGQDLAAAGYK